MFPFKRKTCRCFSLLITLLIILLIILFTILFYSFSLAPIREIH